MLAGECVKHGLVGLSLSLNGRLSVVAQEAELGAEQTNTLSLQACSLLSGLAVTDVCVQLNAGAVSQHALTVEVSDGLAVCVLDSCLAVSVGGLGVNDALVGVNVHDGAVSNIGHALSRHNSGQAQAASQNSGVRLGATVRGNQGDNLLGVQGCGISRCQVNSSQDERLVRDGDAGSLLAGQLSNDAGTHVVDVGHALSHVAAQGSHLVSEGGCSLPDCALGSHLLSLNQLDSALNECTVGSHLRGGLQNSLAVAACILCASEQVFLHADRCVLDALCCSLSGLAAQTQTVLGFLDGLRHLKNGANNAAGVYADALVGSHKFMSYLWFVYSVTCFFTRVPANRQSKRR